MLPYLVVVVLKPTKDESDRGVQPKIVVEAKTVLANDQGHATSKALKSVPTEYENFDDRLEVSVLPFQRVGK